MNRFESLLLCSALLLVSLPAGAVCFTVFDRNSHVVYQDTTPPVDMSRPLHETVPRRFPDGQLVISDGACVAQIVKPAVPTTARAPLLTDRKTAQAMKVPYTVLSGEVVMVPQGYAPSSPRVNIISSDASERARTGVVITELHDPPLTIVQSSPPAAGDGTR